MMDAKEKNKLAGIFLLIHGGIQAFVMLLIGLIYGIMGIAIFATARHADERMFGAGIFVFMVVMVAIVSAIFVLPQLIGGWKMLKERPGARTWGIIGSILSCLSFPLGTAAGVFGLVFLFGEDGERFYLGGRNQNTFNQNTFNPAPVNPPQPYNWQ